MIHNCILMCILSKRKSSYLSIPEKKWHSVPSGPRVHYFSGMDRYSDFLLYRVCFLQFIFAAISFSFDLI